MQPDHTSKIHHLISPEIRIAEDFGRTLSTSKVSDASAEARRLRRMNNTPQEGAIEGNAADDTLMGNQGVAYYLFPKYLYSP